MAAVAEPIMKVALTTQWLFTPREEAVSMSWEVARMARPNSVLVERNQRIPRTAAVMTYTADRTLLTQAGATFSQLAGCCGLAGNFGMQAGHYDVSVAVAENSLLPALRAAAPGDVYLADGYSCRTQASQLAGVQGLHLAELLAAHLE